MSKSKRYDVPKRKDERAEEEREERLLRQIASTRIPTPPPGHFHDTGEKQRQKKNRKKERSRLRDMTKEFNNG